MTKTILITGAGGNIGTKLRAHFTALGWNLRLLDVTSGGDPAILEADLSLWNDAWVEQFAGVDAVIHLAGRPAPDTGWADIQRYNLDLCMAAGSKWSMPETWAWISVPLFLAWGLAVCARAGRANSNPAAARASARHLRMPEIICFAP